MPTSLHLVVIFALLGLSGGFKGSPSPRSGVAGGRMAQGPPESSIVTPVRGLSFSDTPSIMLKRSILSGQILKARKSGDFDGRPSREAPPSRGRGVVPRGRGGGGGRGGGSGGYSRGNGAPNSPGFVSDSRAPLTFVRTEKIIPAESPDLATSALGPISKQVLLKKGFVNLTAVQAKVYDAVKEGGDIVVRSRTGTGKTLAFGIPLIEKCASERGGNKRDVKLVIMEPTRELAIQVTEELKTLCTEHGLSIMTVYGGASMVTQRDALTRGVDIVVATPGRLLDHIVHGSIEMGTVNHVVLDEGDVMLEMGFQKAVQSILENVRSPGEDARLMAGSALRDDSYSSGRRGQAPQMSLQNKGGEAASRHTQVLLFSATMPPWICKITEEHMATPVFFDAVQEGETKLAPTIEHLYLTLPKSRNRIESFASYADDIVAVKGTGKQTIVFTNTREEANTIVASESFQQLRVGVLHGDISQAGRQQVIRAFKDGKLDVLVATDVAARGLDISGVDLVIQLGVPMDSNTYVHRSGRTGRSGRNGTSVVLCTDADLYKLPLLEKQLNMKFSRMRPPSAKDIKQNIVKIATTKFLNDASHSSAFTKEFLDDTEGLLDTFESQILHQANRGSSKISPSDLVVATPEGGKAYSPLFVRHIFARCLAGLAGSKQLKPRSLFTGMKGKCTLTAPASLLPVSPGTQHASDYLSGLLSKTLYDRYGVSAYVDVAAIARSLDDTDEGSPTIYFDVSQEHAQELLGVASEGGAEEGGDGGEDNAPIAMCKRLPDGLESQVNSQANGSPRQNRYQGYGADASSPRTSGQGRGRGGGSSGGGSGYRPQRGGGGRGGNDRGGGGGGGYRGGGNRGGSPSSYNRQSRSPE